jgi:hypothetical protein
VIGNGKSNDESVVQHRATTNGDASFLKLTGVIVESVRLEGDRLIVHYR